MQEPAALLPTGASTGQNGYEVGAAWEELKLLGFVASCVVVTERIHGSGTARQRRMCVLRARGSHPGRPLHCLPGGSAVWSFSTRAASSAPLACPWAAQCLFLAEVARGPRRKITSSFRYGPRPLFGADNVFAINAFAHHRPSLSPSSSSSSEKWLARNRAISFG